MFSDWPRGPTAKAKREKIVEYALERKKRKGAISTFHVYHDRQLFLPPICFYVSFFSLRAPSSCGNILFWNVSAWKFSRRVMFLESLPLVWESGYSWGCIRRTNVATELRSPSKDRQYFFLPIRIKDIDIETLIEMRFHLYPITIEIEATILWLIFSANEIIEYLIPRFIRLIGFGRQFS